MELKGKVKIYYAASEQYRICEQELEHVNKNTVVGIFKGEKKWEKVGIEQTPKSKVELRKAEKELNLRWRVGGAGQQTFWAEARVQIRPVV